jgi:hypothetical protein
VRRAARILLAALAAALAVGCGEEEKSEEDRAADVAKRYVSSYSNKEIEKCAGTLARGVDPKLCGDLAPLAARVNPETKASKVSGNTAKVTVTGAGNNTRLEISLVKQGGDWKVTGWRAAEND